MQCEWAIFSLVAFPALQYFSTLSYNGTILEKKKLFEHKICVLIYLQIMSEIFLILRRTEPDTIKNVY